MVGAEDSLKPKYEVTWTVTNRFITNCPKTPTNDPYGRLLNQSLLTLTACFAHHKQKMRRVFYTAPEAILFFEEGLRIAAKKLGDNWPILDSFEFKEVNHGKKTTEVPAESPES